MVAYSYSAGTCESYHAENSRIAFPGDQKTYGECWHLIADELASDFHSNHDGWEATWPLQLRIYKDAAEVARFTVEREFEPTFSAWEAEVSQQAAVSPAEQVGTSNASDPK